MWIGFSPGGIPRCYRWRRTGSLATRRRRVVFSARSTTSAPSATDVITGTRTAAAGTCAPSGPVDRTGHGGQALEPVPVLEEEVEVEQVVVGDRDPHAA